MNGRIGVDALGLVYTDLPQLVAIGCWSTVENRRAMFSENTKCAVLSKVASKSASQSGGGGTGTMYETMHD